MERTSVELPVIIQEDMSTYLFLALPMCVLRIEDKLEPWFYENFVNIYMKEPNDFLYIGYDFRNDGIFDPFKAESISFKRLAPENIVDAVYNAMKANSYCYIFLDEYYIEASNYYRKNKRIHDSLIYGYDAEKDCFLAIAMNHNERLDKLQYPVSQFVEAYTSAACYKQDAEYRPIVFFQQKYYPLPYVFSLERFITSLEDYLNSKNCNHVQYLQEPERSIKCFGMDAEKQFLKDIQNCEELELDFFHFRSICFLYEHKKGLKQRFQYILSASFSERLSRDIEAFGTVVNAYNIIRMLILKYRILQEAGSKNKLQIIKNDIIQRLTNAIAEEDHYLRRVLEALKLLPYDAVREKPLPPDIANIAELSICNDEAQTSFRSTYVYSWEKPHGIQFVCVPKRQSIKVEIPGQEPQIYTSMEESNRIKVCMPIHDAKTDKLQLEITSAFPIDNNLDIAIYETNLCKDAKASASCSWDSEDGVYSAEKAIDGNEYTIWNASKDWHPGDYLEVEFNSSQKINCIQLRERKDLQRIREYSLAYLDAKGNWTEILKSSGSLQGKVAVHFFETIVTSKIRFILWKTESDSVFSDESGLCSFEAYYYVE